MCDRLYEFTSLFELTAHRAGLPDAASTPRFPSLSTAALTRHNSVAAVLV
jgi:hypothetical protein